MTNQRITDRDVRAAFLARAGDAPSADLAERISAATAGSRQSRQFFVLPGFANPAATRSLGRRTEPICRSCGGDAQAHEVSRALLACCGFLTSALAHRHRQESLG